MQRNKVYVGNNIDVLKTFPDNSIDSIVTDPPYGLGKEPNADALLKDWLEHGYHEVKGKGFMGKEWDAFVPQPIFWKECYRVLKHGGHVLSFAGTRTYDWMVIGLRLAGFEIRDQLAWIYGSGFPKSHDISKAIEKKFGAEREVVGKKSGNINAMPDGRPSRSNVAWESEIKEYNITTPATDQAKQWQGWGTALKPALEPIVMARKPLDGTVADNVLKHGVGGINIDGCRVEHDETISVGFMKTNREKGLNSTSYGGESDKRTEDWVSTQGRFPANVIHDGSDEVVALFPDVGGGSYKEANARHRKGFMLGDVNGTSNAPDNYGDSGSASRFFYTAKASQTERNWGLDGFESDVTTDGRNKPIDNAFNRGETQRKNIHPTVKPIDLMRYLVRLVTPKGGVCLDPFLGSGTTAVACKSEKFDYIGIELSQEYADIAEARIKAEVVQYDIFDILED
jgi:site-specific DNA-methyltransferase (adenine-specific)